MGIGSDIISDVGKFAPSPIMLPTKIVGAAADALSGGNDTSNARNQFVSQHKAIAPYLAMVARSAANAGIDPNFQAAVLAQENGGFVRWSTNAESGAGAEGIAQFMAQTWGGQWNPYRNKSRNDPHYAIPAQSIFLRNLLKQTNGNMTRAAGLYYGAQDPKYTGGVQTYYNQLKSAHVFDKSGKGGVLGAFEDAASGLLSGAENLIPGVGLAKTTADLVDTILHPSKAGDLLSKITVYFVRLIGKAIWDYILAPPFHWCQRAVVYYFDNIMGSQDGSNTGFYYTIAGPTTVAFWAVGYAILWRNSDDLSVSAKDDPEDSAFGKAISFAGSAVARRNVTSPGKVAQATPTKPSPITSEATVNKTRSLSATRRRQVKIGTGGKNGGTGETETDAEGTATDTPELADLAEIAA